MKRTRRKGKPSTECSLVSIPLVGLLGPSDIISPPFGRARKNQRINQHGSMHAIFFFGFGLGSTKAPVMKGSYSTTRTFCSRVLCPPASPHSLAAADNDARAGTSEYEDREEIADFVAAAEGTATERGCVGKERGCAVDDEEGAGTE